MAWSRRKSGIHDERCARHHALLHPRGRRAQLEREIAKVCRKVVKEIALGAPPEGAKVTLKNLEEFLACTGSGTANRGRNQVGLVTGLAWTEVGGDLLSSSALKCPARGG